MVYALQKFKHYLLGNRYIFYVDHMALMYLVNKPQVFGRMIKGLLLFLEGDFKIVYKLNRSYLMADTLSRLPNQVESVGILDQTTDVCLFTLQLEWLQNVYDYLLKGMMQNKFTTSQRQYLVQKTKPFVLQNGMPYRFGQDNRFHHVLQLEHVPTILHELHSEVGGRHFSSHITMRKIFDANYWWPTMNKDVHEFCRTYDFYQWIENLLSQNMAKLIITLLK